jgi:hypothetical protein
MRKKRYTDKITLEKQIPLRIRLNPKKRIKYSIEDIGFGGRAYKRKTGYI